MSCVEMFVVFVVTVVSNYKSGVTIGNAISICRDKHIHIYQCHSDKLIKVYGV